MAEAPARLPFLSVAVTVAARHTALLIGILAFLLYLATLSRDYSADSLLFAIAVESGRWQDLVDPYHVLLHPLG